MAEKVARCGMLTSLALVMGLLESFIPMPIPWAKIGISNCAVLFAIIAYDGKTAFTVMLAKVALSSLLYSGISGFFYSLAGGMLSYVIMLILSRFSCFSPAGLSIAGAAAHNTAQVCVAAALTQTKAVFGYLPVLLICSVFTGALTGWLVYVLLRRLSFVLPQKRAKTNDRR